MNPLLLCTSLLGPISISSFHIYFYVALWTFHPWHSEAQHNVCPGRKHNPPGIQSSSGRSPLPASSSGEFCHNKMFWFHVIWSRCLFLFHLHEIFLRAILGMEPYLRKSSGAVHPPSAQPSSECWVSQKDMALRLILADSARNQSLCPPEAQLRAKKTILTLIHTFPCHLKHGKEERWTRPIDSKSSDQRPRGSMQCCHPGKKRGGT